MSTVQATGIVTDHLAVWVLAALVLGVALPDLRVLQPLAPFLLAIMVGSISLTLAPESLRRVRPRALTPLLLAHTGMVLVALAVARVLTLSPELTLGLVLVGAVTPELSSPVLTHLARGRTVLGIALLLAATPISVALVGLVAIGLETGPMPSPAPLVRSMLLVVVLPMVVALGVRWRWPRTVERHEGAYPVVSALMVVGVMVLAGAASASLLRPPDPTVAVVLLGAGILNAAGYGIGWLGGSGLLRVERVAGVFAVGTRDFAVAAALVLSAGLPEPTVLPAALFGAVEMVSAAWLAGRWKAGSGPEGSSD